MISAAVAPLVLNFGCSGSEKDVPVPIAPGLASGTDVVVGLYPSSMHADPEAAMRAALGRADFSWLGRDESVLIKIASNSGNSHPATTSPAAVRAMVAELKARGAGRIVVGEQSGVEFVRAVEDGRRFSSTRALLQSNGLVDAIESSGAEPHFFEDQGWDGYFAATLPAGSSWEEPVMIPSIVREVDHIVYLPRLSSHALAGYTMAHKISVGWMRDDTRNALHTHYDSFYEKFTELSYATEIKSRLRLVATLAEKMLLHYGPDTGTIYDLDPRVVLVSQSLASHDAAALSLFVHASRAVTQSPPGIAYTAATADTFNQFFVRQIVPVGTGLPWGPLGQADYRPLVAHAFEDGVSQDRCLMRAWDLSGGRPASVRMLLDGASPSAEVTSALEQHSEGMLRIG